MNEWEKEFPIFYRFFKGIKNPRKFIANIIVDVERKIRKVVFLGILSTMGFVIYYRLNQYFTSGDFSTLRYFPAKEDWALWVFKASRNLSYAIMMLDFVLIVPVMIVHVIRKNYPKLVKVGGSWFLLFMFIPFSYAFAGLITDLIVIASVIIQSSLKQVGAPVNLPY